MFSGLNTHRTSQKCLINAFYAKNTPKIATKKYLYISDIHPHPWHTLESDLVYYKKMDFLAVLDHFSKFLIALICGLYSGKIQWRSYWAQWSLANYHVAQDYIGGNDLGIVFTLV